MHCGRRPLSPGHWPGYPRREAGANRPANGATNVKDTPTLAWTAGEKADKHDVYFGTPIRIGAVTNATEPAPSPIEGATGIYRGRHDPSTALGTGLAAASYVPTEAPLQWNKTYYWRIPIRIGTRKAR